MHISAKVRELKKEEFPLITQYFLNADPSHLLKMGVDASKLPSEPEWMQLLADDHERSFSGKEAYYLIWELNGKPIGHSSINKISYGEEAYIHLHVWNPNSRKSGLGTFFISESISAYFKTFKLKQLCCEPNAKNESPNKTLQKVGFTFEQKYTTIPGWINFQQEVNRWVLLEKNWEY